MDPFFLWCQEQRKRLEEQLDALQSGHQMPSLEKPHQLSARIAELDRMIERWQAQNSKAIPGQKSSADATAHADAGGQDSRR